MRALVMERGQLRVETLPDPRPETGEVVVRSLACGVCGSDLHAAQHTEAFVAASLRGGGAFKLTTFEPVVMGHEFCAEVLEHGPGTQRTLPVGSHVCAVPVLPRPRRMYAVGYDPAAPGGFAERMLLNEAMLVAVPAGTPPRHAALTEPMAVGWHAVRKAALQGNEEVVVVGCGPVGLAVIGALRRLGAAHIRAADFSPRRRELALAMGAHEVVDPAAQSPWQDWQRGPEPDTGAPLLPVSKHPVVMFECVGVPGMLDQLMAAAPHSSRIVVVGVCLETDRYQPLHAINRELSVQYVLGYTVAEFRDTLHAIADGSLDVAPLITRCVGLADGAQVFADLKDPARDGKVLIEAWR